MLITEQNILNLSMVKDINEIRVKWEKIKDPKKKAAIK